MNSEFNKMLNEQKNIQHIIETDKMRFSNLLKNGLGQHIKENANNPIVIIQNKKGIRQYIKNIWNKLHRKFY